MLSIIMYYVYQRMPEPTGESNPFRGPRAQNKKARPSGRMSALCQTLNGDQAFWEFATTTLRQGFNTAMRKNRREDVGSCSDQEHAVPVAGRLLHVVCERHQKSRRSLRGIEQTGIGGCELRSERVRASRWEERIDLTPGEEHEAGQQHEPQRILSP